MGQKNVRGKTMTKEKSLLKNLKELNPKAIFFVGLGEAMIGIGSQYTKNTVAIYSASKIVKTLMKKGANREDALDDFRFNIECFWAGENTPIIMNDF